MSPFAPGTTIGTYRLDYLLGEGGMGTVYRATDTKLNRAVAIKFVSADLADAAARRRFEREAQLASSLNHPHILTVYDAGELDGRQYLVSELVDGGTLGDWIKERPRSWQEVVELVIGLADGLAAAHEAGILHRDVKPANILITKTGYAKLADFGLAKLRESPSLVADAATETRTRPGGIVGTVGYMSPEQASGQPVDARSDVFSFAVVLYELLAGRRPFRGPTDLEVLLAIAHQSPDRLPESTPLALRGLVERALQKDPAQRVQTMREVVANLRQLVRQSDTAPMAPQRHGRALAWASAVALVAVALSAAIVMWRPDAATPVATQFIQLTNFADSATSPALSRDGRMLTFIRGPLTFFSPGQVYVKRLPDGEPVQLTNDGEEKMGPQFLPDGARISYSTGIGAASPSMDTWVVSVDGGPSQRLLTNAEGLTWFSSRAGQLRVLFSEMTGLGGQMSIVSATERRTEPRNLYVPPPPDGMAHRSYRSPDGQWMLVVEMDMKSWLPCRLVSFEGGSTGKPVGPAPAQCTDAAWSPDGMWMYFTAMTLNGVHIWRQRVPDGAPEQVTFGTSTEEGIHFTPDGRSFVTSVGTSQSTLWVHDSRGDRQITSEGYVFMPSLSADGKTVLPGPRIRPEELESRSSVGGRSGDRTAPAAVDGLSDPPLLDLRGWPTDCVRFSGRTRTKPGVAFVPERATAAAASQHDGFGGRVLRRTRRGDLCGAEGFLRVSSQRRRERVTEGFHDTAGPARGIPGRAMDSRAGPQCLWCAGRVSGWRRFSAATLRSVRATLGN